MSDAIEMQLLKLLLLQPQRLSKSALNEGLFSDRGAEIFREARSLWSDGKEVSASLIASSGISDDAKKLLLAIDSYGPPEISADSAIEVLTKKKARVDFAKICRDYHDRIHDPKSNPSDVIAAAHSAMTDMVLRGSSGQRKFGSDFSAVNERLEWRAANPGKILGIETGFSKLDRIINGVQPCKLYFVGARPSVGKTSFSGCVTHSASTTSPDVTVIDYTLEMDADELRDAMISRVSGVSIATYTGKQFTQSEIVQISRAQREIKKWRWIIYDDFTDIDLIESSAQAERARIGPDAPLILKIDYIQLVTGGKGGNLTEKLGNVSGRLKKLAKSTRSSVIALAQLKRLENKFDFAQKRTTHRPPVLEDLRDCGSFEQDGDVVFLLDRDIIHNPTEAKLILAKHRAGKTHPGLPFTFHESTTTFIETITP